MYSFSTFCMISLQYVLFFHNYNAKIYWSKCAKWKRQFLCTALQGAFIIMMEASLGDISYIKMKTYHFESEGVQDATDWQSFQRIV